MTTENLERRVIGSYPVVKGLRRVNHIRTEFLEGKWELMFSRPPYSSLVALVRDIKTKEIYMVTFDGVGGVRLDKPRKDLLDYIIEDGFFWRYNFDWSPGQKILYQFPRSGGSYAYVLEEAVAGKIKRVGLAGSNLIFQTNDDRIFAARILVI